MPFIYHNNYCWEWPTIWRWPTIVSFTFDKVSNLPGWSADRVQRIMLNFVMSRLFTCNFFLASVQNPHSTCKRHAPHFLFSSTGKRNWKFWWIGSYNHAGECMATKIVCSLNTQLNILCIDVRASSHFLWPITKIVFSMIMTARDHPPIHRDWTSLNLNENKPNYLLVPCS